MKRPPTWIPRSAVLAIHEALLAQHGGLRGLLDPGLLDGALAAPRNLLAYRGADIPRLAAAYAYAITKNHPFVDANKRVALTIAGVFLERKGLRLEAPEVDAAQAMWALSAGDLREEQFADWLRSNCSKRGSAQARTGKPPPRRGRRAPPGK